MFFEDRIILNDVKRDHIQHSLRLPYFLAKILQIGSPDTHKNEYDKHDKSTKFVHLEFLGLDKSCLHVCYEVVSQKLECVVDELHDLDFG